MMRTFWIALLTLPVTLSATAQRSNDPTFELKGFSLRQPLHQCPPGWTVVKDIEPHRMVCHSGNQTLAGGRAKHAFITVFRSKILSIGLDNITESSDLEAAYKVKFGRAGEYRSEVGGLIWRKPGQIFAVTDRGDGTMRVQALDRDAQRVLRAVQAKQAQPDL